MNSDTPQPGPTPASPTPALPRSSNLKGRWKRGPNPVTGAIVASPTTPASCGVVTDVTSARESLSGQHARGYERPAAPVAVSAPVAPRTVPPPAQRTETSAPRPEGPVVLTPRPGTFNPPQPRSSSHAPRRDTSSERPAQPVRPAQSSRPAQDNRSGERENFVALKPDPANDAAPRRLRTESSRPVPVEEYSPSNFGRVPDKSVPAKHEHRSERDRHSHKDRQPEKREAASSTSSERPRPHATISARVPSDKEGKSGGIFGFIKKMFSASNPDKKEEKKSSSRRESDDEEEDDKDEGSRRRHHSSHGESRHSSSHRRSSRR
jgi:hypothetical protein